MAKFNPDQLQYLMGLDEAIRDVEKQNPKDPRIHTLKTKFYDLAGEEFDRSVLREVHEVTIEGIVKRQAEGFYENFPNSIKKELVNEYIEMEHQMRRDKFYNFCLCIYKQIECCIDYSLSSSILIQRLSTTRSKSLYQNENLKRDQEDRKKIVLTIFFHGDTAQYSFLNYYDKNQGKWFDNNDWDNLFESNFSQISDILLKMTFPNKFKLVLHLVKFQQKVSEKDFNKDLVFFEYIRQSRHLAHGGIMSATEGKISEGINPDEKEQLFIDAYNNKYSNYLLYHGFLASFVENIPNF